jgi:hypothetical protein
VLRDALRTADMAGRETVLAMLPEIYAGHVLNTDRPFNAAGSAPPGR